jgi:hypothetical protein
MLMLAFGFKRVPEDPPHVGILTFWNRRIRVLVGEGTHLLADYFPIFLGVNVVKVERVNLNFLYTDVRCRGEVVNGKPTAGPAVTVEVAVTYEPDYEGKHGGRDVGADRIIKFLNSGGADGVKHILQDLTGEEVREIASEYTWEQFVFLKAPLAASLLMMVSEAKLRKLPRESDGSISDAIFNITPDEYVTLPVIEQPLRYVLAAENETERTTRQREMEVLIRIIRENGIGDVIDLGLQLIRLNVVRIEPEGAGLNEDAELAAREHKQREAENLDFETEIQLAEKYIAAARRSGGDMTIDAALERVRINRGRATENIVRSSGNLLADAAALFTSKS